MEFELRPWRDSDGADFFRYGCTPDIIRYMTPGYPRTLADCARVVAGFAREDSRKQRSRAVTVLGTAVGSVGAFLQANGTAQLAYWLGTEFQRQGVMTAVLRQFCAQLWADYELTALTARPHEDNLPSRRTLERAGFRRMPDGVYRLERPCAG